MLYGEIVKEKLPKIHVVRCQLHAIKKVGYRNSMSKVNVDFQPKVYEPYGVTPFQQTPMFD